jgi:dTDP-4-amino-4,6-dideoxygalactose transaminase
MSSIPYGRQDINQADIDAVVAVLQSDFLTQGPAVPAFESAVANYCKAQQAVAVNSATSALHIACLALGVGKGDIVWTTPIHTYNLSVECLAEKLAVAEKTGRLPKVLIPVHLCGQPCDMAGIHALSQQYGFKIIEDASHAIGGRYKAEPIGNSRYSDITVFSFHPVKIITTGEGGMAVTNDIALAKCMRLLRSHGITNVSADFQPRSAAEIWNYQQTGLGFNYRMTDIQAALGLSQMQRLDEFVTKRLSIAKRYDQLLSALPVVTPWQHEDSYSGYHLYVICLKLNEIKKTQRQVYDALHAAKILVNLHYIPVYRQPYYEALGFSVGHCPNAESYFSHAISIPMYPDLTLIQQDFVVQALRLALTE